MYLLRLVVIYDCKRNFGLLLGHKRFEDGSLGSVKLRKCCVRVRDLQHQPYFPKYKSVPVKNDYNLIKLTLTDGNCSTYYRLNSGLQPPGSSGFPGLLAFPGVAGFSPSASPAALSGLHNPTIQSALLQVDTHEHT